MHIFPSKSVSLNRCSEENVEELRKKESFWQHELNTFQPLGLNEREVPLLF